MNIKCELTKYFRSLQHMPWHPSKLKSEFIFLKIEIVYFWKVKGHETWNNKVFPFIAAYALTSIQVQNPFIQLGKADVDIRCLVNDSENESITGIQLIRSNTNIVSVKEAGVLWQDHELQQRAVADGSVMNATSSYLQMTILRQNVTKNDSGIYSCTSFAVSRNHQESKNTFLNITGNYIFQL